MLRGLRNVRRYTEILEVLLRYGFHDLVQDLELPPPPAREGTAAPPPRPVGPAPRPVLLRMAMEELGPTFIKLGQVLSMRPDLVPAEWAEEFKRLQTDCPVIGFDAVKARLEESFPGTVWKLFASIEAEPLAAGSMAQVHRAVLRTGERVVVKVLRPGIREKIAVDVDILRRAARLAESRSGDLAFSPGAVVEEFGREIRKEVDLRREGRATDGFRGLFRDDPEVGFPRVYWEATTRDVLTVEEIEGAVLARTPVATICPPDRRRLVPNGARAILQQCLEFGFFHVDPHPGNLIAQPGGKLVFIDCGMNGRLDEATTGRLADLIAAVVDCDADRFAEVILELTDSDPEELDERTFRSDMRDVMGGFEQATLDRFDLSGLLTELFERLRRHRLRVPGDLVLLLKSIGTIEAVGRELDPLFDLIESARPHLERLMRRKYGPRAAFGRVAGTVQAYARLAETLPDDLRVLLAKLRRNRFSVKLDHTEVDGLLETVEQAAWTVGLGFVLAAMLVASSVLVLAGGSAAEPSVLLIILGLATFGMALVLGLRFVWRGMRSRR